MADARPDGIVGYWNFDDYRVKSCPQIISRASIPQEIISTLMVQLLLDLDMVGVVQVLLSAKEISWLSLHQSFSIMMSIVLLSGSI